MKYRVVQRADGTYKCQMRVFFFWWQNSVHAASTDKEEQIEYARDAEDLMKPLLATHEVWPRERRLIP